MGAARFRWRAVVLASLTTVGGLAPSMFETSTQGRFPIPMAVSIAFSLPFATFLVLLLVPALVARHESVATRSETREIQVSPAAG